MIHHRLDQSLPTWHSYTTCGQSRRGGVETSSRTRRSRFLGRVAVAYVQGSLKGGGALCVRRVSNTRLCPEPSPREKAATLVTNRIPDPPAPGAMGRVLCCCSRMPSAAHANVIDHPAEQTPSAKNPKFVSATYAVHIGPSHERNLK